MTAWAASDGYEGVTHAGIAVVAADTGRVLLAQRAADPTDAPEVAETWEFPGGGLDEGEDAQAGAVREFSEEIGYPLPPGEVVNGWRGGDQGQYQGFVYRIEAEFALDDFAPNEEVQAVRWYSRDEVEQETNLRPEVRDGTDWDLIFEVSGNEDDMTETASEVEPDAEMEWDHIAAAVSPIPVHGVLAPEDVETGDGRGFNAGSMTARPLRLPFRFQDSDIGGHDGAYVIGSVDRLMRKDGMIHWEGALMPSERTDDFVNLLAFFEKFGVSVDGLKGALDAAKVKASGVMWFEAVQAAGLTAVAIPAFQEAYVAFGPHPDMPDEFTPDMLVASGLGADDVVGARADSQSFGQSFGRGPGWVTNPTDTKRIHDYWTKKGEPGYAKIGWGTNGDFTRAKALIGAEIAKHSPDKTRFLNQIIAQWHHDALGYWPGDLGMPGNPPDTAENRKRAAIHASVTASAFSADSRALPPLAYFERHPDTGATYIEDPDEFGFRRTHGYVAEWGVCHIGYSGRCVEPPRTGSDEYPEFHLGITRASGEDGEQVRLKTGLLTYKVDHRDAATILSETPEQCHFDNVENAWAAVVLGEDERGIWYSGVVLPHVPEEDVVLIEASGQVSGEWKYGALRACLTVNVPGYPVQRASAAYDDEGNMVALAASAFSDNLETNGAAGSECDENSPRARMAALAMVDAEVRFEALRAEWLAQSKERV